MRLTEKQRPELKKFIERNYRKNYILLNDIFFDYLFKRGVSGKYNFKVLTAKNDLIGMSGEIPNQLNFFGNAINSCFLVNLMIDKKLRNLGLGPRLIIEAEREYDLLYTCSYNNEIKPLFQKWGWIEMPNLRRFVKVISFEKSNELALGQLRKDNDIADDIGITDQGFSFASIEFFDASIFEFWQNIRIKYPITIERNVDYLNWRFAEHPIFKYRNFVAKKNGKIESLIVLRIEEPPGYKIARIVDFVSTDEAEKFTLYKAIQYCKSNNIDLIDFFFTGNFHINSLGSVGFKETDKKPYSLIPFLFNPMDRERTCVNFAFKPINKKLKDYKAKDINNWYITKTNGDMDRPN